MGQTYGTIFPWMAHYNSYIYIYYISIYIYINIYIICAWITIDLQYFTVFDLTFIIFICHLMFTRVWSHLKPSEKPRLSRCQALASEEANRAQSPKEGLPSKQSGVCCHMLPLCTETFHSLQAENDRLNELREKNIKKRHKAAFLKLQSFTYRKCTL